MNKIKSVFYVILSIFMIMSFGMNNVNANEVNELDLSLSEDGENYISYVFYEDNVDVVINDNFKDGYLYIKVNSVLINGDMINNSDIVCQVEVTDHYNITYYNVEQADNVFKLPRNVFGGNLNNIIRFYQRTDDGSINNANIFTGIINIINSKELSSQMHFDGTYMDTDGNEVVISKDGSKIFNTYDAVNVFMNNIDNNGQVQTNDKIGLFYNYRESSEYVTLDNFMNVLKYNTQDRSIEVITSIDESIFVVGKVYKSTKYRNIGVSYSTHVQDIGWQSWKQNGEMSGTTGKSKRLEGIKIQLDNIDKNIGIKYSTHIQDIGWQSWKQNGEMSGTTGQSKRLEAIKIELTGEIIDYYDICYRVHAENLGWLDWAKNGENAGSAGYSYRLEGIEIKLVVKGNNPPGKTTMPYKQRYIRYNSHIQDIGWQGQRYDGATSGTSGQSKRLEAMTIALDNQRYSGNIEYQTHVQNIGWQNWKTNGQTAGTSGQSLRLEAIKIRLTGEMANQYDIYYRVHAQNFGWLGWAKNGENSGTEGYSYRLEAIEIKLVKKGDLAPGNTSNSYYRFNSWVSSLNAAKDSSQLIVVSVYNNNYATVSMHTKGNNGYWVDNYSVNGRVGKNGIDKIREGDGKTPTGIYSLHTPFGIKSNPGCPLGYIQVNNNHYWGGGNPEYYNKLVDASTIPNYNSTGAEHIISYGSLYNYCLAVGYNMEQVVGKGSAIFLHCSGKGATGGCVSIPEANMIYTLQNIRSDAKIIIDYSSKIGKY